VSENHTASVTVESGVKGWLLVFVVWLGLVSPIFWVGFMVLVMSRMETVNPDDAQMMRDFGLDQLLWIVTILRETIHIATALLLVFHRQAISVWIALSALWLAGPLFPFATWLIVGGELRYQGLGRSILFAAIWSGYLWLSKRVSITYGFRQ